MQDQKVQSLKEKEEKQVGQDAPKDEGDQVEQPDEYYLQWEPFTLWERTKSFITNTYEIWYILYMIVVSVVYPSLSGTIMLIAVAPLMSTMTCSPEKRYFRAIIIMLI